MTFSPDVMKLNPQIRGKGLRLKAERVSNPKRYEERLLEQLAERNIETPMREVTFCIHGRKWRFDLAWVEPRVAVEVDGATHSGGRHTRGSGYKEDCIKLNHAAREGWKVLRFPTDMVTDGSAVEFIEETLKEIGTAVLEF